MDLLCAYSYAIIFFGLEHWKSGLQLVLIIGGLSVDNQTFFALIGKQLVTIKLAIYISNDSQYYKFGLVKRIQHKLGK